LHSDPTWKYFPVKPAFYVASKAALNAYTIVLAYDLRDTAFKVNAVDPGYTATDFNNHRGPGTVPDAAARLVKAAMLGPDGPTGQFFSDDNVPATGISPW
jgi:NAD(P)-dependent dehydrogenase (short-subunit alcohol dehydrogenase family)